MDQRRLLLAFGLSLLLLVLYQELVVRRYSEAPPSPGAPPRVAPEEPAAPSPVRPVTPEIPDEIAAPADDSAPAVTIDTDVFQATITTTGGRLRDIRLKQYRRTVDPSSDPLDLVLPSPILPATFHLAGGTSDARVVYHADRSELRLTGNQQGEIVLTGATPGELQIEKHYKFAGDAYAIQIHGVLAGTAVPPSVALVVTPLAPASANDAAYSKAVALVNRRLVEKTVAELQTESTPVSPAVWAGFAEQYFLAVALGPRGGTQAAMTSVSGVPIVRVDAPVEGGRAEFSLYAGPKKREDLARAGPDLERALDFGWFWFIAIPLLQALRVLSGLVGNYGIAIILLTTLVKLATIPLTQTTFRNMREMQKLQPQMTKLRERFKDDQVALQKEMMELYRRHRVNPLSGCLPMLLQLPIFVGLYNALIHAIELRHAPFALWINDLSAPDRLMVGGIGIPVLTLLMGASMFVQQWLTPQQGDPAQQRMMMIMPLIFTFMFINFPSGLVLYWLVNNILSIAQQYVMMREAT